MTEFEKKVIEAIRKIPKGKVTTYKRIAEKMGGSGFSRAVGNVARKAPLIDSSIPCHRVIKSNGETGKYRFGKEKKMRILRREGVSIKNGKVDLKKFIF